MECQFPTFRTRIQPVDVHRGVGKPIVATHQQVSIQQPKYTAQYSEADNWRVSNYGRWESDGLRKQLEPGKCKKNFFSQFARPSKSARNLMMQQSKQVARMKMNINHLKENAWSLIVNYHGEASNHGHGNSTKQLFSPSTHSRFLEVLSEFANFAAQGLCEGTPVVSRSCRCSERIGCIFE